MLSDQKMQPLKPYFEGNKMAQKKFRHLKYTSHRSVDPSVHRSVIRNGLRGRVAVKKPFSMKEPSDFNLWCK